MNIQICIIDIIEVHNNKELIKNLKRKGISLDNKDKGLFSKSDYFQVINVYKELFIKSVERIILINKQTNNIL